MAKQLVTLLLSSTMSTSTSIRTSKPWCFPSCLKSMRRRPLTTIPSSTSLYAFTITQTRYRKQRTSYMLLSRAPTLFPHTWLNLNALSTKLTVRTGRMSTRSLCFGIVLIRHYAIDLLSSLTFLASTPISYKSSNN
jgi:hypothetical protein